jgi:hypothetical protein
MRGCVGLQRRLFISIIDSLLGSPKVPPHDRSNRGSHYILRHINAFGTTTPRICGLRFSAMTNPNLWKNG